MEPAAGDPLDPGEPQRRHRGRLDDVDGAVAELPWPLFPQPRTVPSPGREGFEVELFVEAEPAAPAEWHLGRALPTWNRRSPAAQARWAATVS